MQETLLLLAMILEKMVSAILMLPSLQISAQIISLNPDMNPHLLQGKNIHYTLLKSVFFCIQSQKEITQEKMKIIFSNIFQIFKWKSFGQQSKL